MRLQRVLRGIGRTVVVLAVAAVAVVAGWYLFVDVPGDLTDLLGVVLVLGLVLASLKLGGRIATGAFPDYNVAEVSVEGPITRDGGGGGVPPSPTSPGADDVVEQIERADDDRNVEALLVKLNTPGGAVVPSDDIRQAAADFDGPTVAYTNDVCASGGMWIASGCDELWARDGSIVGSIGVVFSQFRVHDLFEEQGVSYERIVSGEYKDALSSFKPLEEDEREYLQALSDAWYENFVERVAEGTDMAEAEVRETEARVYLGEEAVEFGMVDELGDRDAIEDDLEARLDAPVTVQEFEPSRGIGERLRGGASSLAYTFGAGVAGGFRGDDGGLRMQ